MKNVIIGLFVVLIAIGVFMILNFNQASPVTGQVVMVDEKAMVKDPASAMEEKEGAEMKKEVASSPQEFSINIIQGGFEPRELTVKKDLPVIFHLTAQTIADGFKEHGFSIREFGVSAKIPLGETVTVEFTPDKIGSYVFFCSVFCGDGHQGQSGILHVIE